MSRPKNVRDPVWGEIVLTDEEWELVNRPVFQRLRRIHQLALTMLVFPGTTHTRFEHSIGTCHVAGRIGNRLREASGDRGSMAFSEEDVRLVRLAGLLHDIGHGPFSHVADPFLDDKGGRKGHEWVGSMIVEHHPEIRSVLDDRTTQAIGALLRGEGPRSVFRDIVSGPADADKVDYLLRDSHYAGVRQGLFDHDYFIDQAVAIPGNLTGESWLGFHSRGVWAVEGMKLARHHMHRTVYGHRNRLVTDLMLQRGLMAALDAGVLPPKLLSLPAPDEDFLEWHRQYHAYDDWAVMTDCCRAPEGSLTRMMFERLRDHNLLKLLVFEEGEAFRDLLGGAARELVTRHEGDDCRAIETEVARELGFEPELIIVRVDNAANPLGLPTGARLANEDINFLMRSGVTEPLDIRSEIFAATPPANRWRHRLLVYAPEGRQNDALGRRAKEVVMAALLKHLTTSAANA